MWVYISPILSLALLYNLPRQPVTTSVHIAIVPPRRFWELRVGGAGHQQAGLVLHPQQNVTAALLGQQGGDTEVFPSQMVSLYVAKYLYKDTV